MKIPFFITDVFTNAPYSGNPLATFFDADKLTDTEMQNRAREINFSETTFVYQGGSVNDGFTVRIFTPKAEIEFAGHPTLGTAYLINKHLVKQSAKQIILHLKTGDIKVDFQDDELWMQQKQPVFGKQVNFELLATTLGLDDNDFDTNFPAEEVSTGLPFTIVALKNKKALAKATVNIDAYNELFIKQVHAKGILIFCPESHAPDQQLATRVFVHYLGIPEDPATGSGSGCLGAWLVKNRYSNTSAIDIRIGQGYEMGRPSQLAVKAVQTDSGIDVRVGGKVYPVAKGWW
ncbi:MAG: PhzF family phenazine biosynthesis protein [Lentimicrobiaceae bacterium]|nr:PhzF family phenazine biosynthesis protein [Lentimicrobiaceae bacterium]